MIAQNNYWRRHPPVHLLVAAQVGYEAPAADEPTELGADDLMQMFPMPT